MKSYYSPDYYAHWCKERVIDVPHYKAIRPIHIHRIVKAKEINGLPVDFIIRGVLSSHSEPIEFGVLFSDMRPEGRKYPLPILWKKEGDPQLGEWITPVSKLDSYFKMVFPNGQNSTLRKGK